MDPKHTDPPKKPEGDDKKPKNLLTTIVISIAILLAVISIFNFVNGSKYTETTYSDVVDAMEKGNMYSSMGPVFHEVSFENGMLHIECSEVSKIYAYFGSKVPAMCIAKPGENLTSCDFHVARNARYIRISICTRDGKWADTRGFFRDELGLPPL